MSAAQFKMIEELRQAVGNRARAKILLRCPDAIILSHGAAMGLECRRHTFEAGWEYCQIRASNLNAMRDEHGLLPAVVAGELEQWRRALSRFSAGEDVDGLFEPN